MNKKDILIVLALVIVALGFWFFQINKPNTPVASNVSFDPLNTTYTIDGASVTLVNGKAEEEVLGESPTKITTEIFGEPTLGDLNADGRKDAAIILVDEPGGSGTFYYVAVALNLPSGTKGTNAFLLGDRITPQTLEIRNGEVIANYADRKPGEPMAAQPSIGVSKYLKINGTSLEEVKN